MQLLGSYSSQLTPFMLEQLQKLLETAIEGGEFSGGSSFDATALRKLQQDGQDFSALPAATAGQRALDDSFNRPLALLAARFIALLAEIEDFDSKSSSLLSVLAKDTKLVEDLLYAAALQSWVDTQPQLKGSQQFSWDFGMGYGVAASSAEIVQQDPTNGVVYNSRPPLVSFVNPDLQPGLGSNAAVTRVSPKNLQWTYSTPGVAQELYDVNQSAWAQLSVLEDRPRLNFSSPAVSVVLPRGQAVNGIFQITGNVPGGMVPVYVRTFFHPRRMQSAVAPVNASPTLTTKFPVHPSDSVYVSVKFHTQATSGGQLNIGLKFFDSSNNPVLDGQGNPVLSLLSSQTPTAVGVSSTHFGMVQVPSQYPHIVSAQVNTAEVGNSGSAWIIESADVHTPISISNGYDVDPDTVNVFGLNGIYYFSDNKDFVVTDAGNVTFGNIPDGALVQIRFTEFFPAYQCSVDQLNWSPMLMMDPQRPYPDDLTEVVPIPFGLDTQGKKTLLPITDETGTATGVYIKLTGTPKTEYLVQVSTPADSTSAGFSSVLEIDISKPSYTNGVSLSPFSTFAAVIKSIDVETLASNSRTNVFSGAMLFDRPLTFRFSTLLVRKIFVTFYQENYSLKTHSVEPPDALRRSVLNGLQSALPFAVRRASPPVPEEQTGAQYEFGVEEITADNWQPTVPSIFVAGPFRFSGSPEVIRYDADIQGTVDAYICFRAYDRGGAEKDVQLQGVHVNAGGSIVFPFAMGLVLSTVDHGDLYVKFVHRTGSSVVKKFLLQVL